MNKDGFAWKGDTLNTIREIGDALGALESREDAHDFMRAYQKHTIHAYVNVGYIAGYYDHDTKRRIWEWCETSHPLFGRSEPTPEEAFEAGRRMVTGERHEHT